MGGIGNGGLTLPSWAISGTALGRIFRAVSRNITAVANGRPTLSPLIAAGRPVQTQYAGDVPPGEYYAALAPAASVPLPAAALAPSASQPARDALVWLLLGALLFWLLR